MLGLPEQMRINKALKWQLLVYNYTPPTNEERAGYIFTALHMLQSLSEFSRTVKIDQSEDNYELYSQKSIMNIIQITINLIKKLIIS